MARLGSQLTHSWNRLARSEKLFALLALLTGINWIVQRISSSALPFAGFIDYAFAILAVCQPNPNIEAQSRTISFRCCNSRVSRYVVTWPMKT